MSQAPNPNNPPPPTDYRPQFNAFLQQPSTVQNANPVTRAVVSTMSSRMSTEGNAMTYDHYRAATTSIARGDTTCEFLAAENKHVLQSTGTGPVYTAGKKFHEWVVSPLNKDK